MSASYVYEGNYAVCTFQMSPAPQGLIASRKNKRVKQWEIIKVDELGNIISIPDVQEIYVTAFHQDDKRLLTVEDKNVEVNFLCKAPVHMVASFAAFGAGLFGAIAVVGLVLSGPIGWIAMGLIAVAIVGTVVYAIKLAMHTCTGPMQQGNWLLSNSSVEIDGYPAITQMSMLSCNSGGIIKPFFSLAVAQAAADKIQLKNIKEVGVNAIISAAMGVGFILGLSAIATAATAWAAFTTTLSFGAKTIGGIIFLTPPMVMALWHQKEYMRDNDEMKGSETYQNMNEQEGNAFPYSQWYNPISTTKETFFGISEEDKDPLIGDADPSDPSNMWDLESFEAAKQEMGKPKTPSNYAKNPEAQAYIDKLIGQNKNELYWKRNPTAGAFHEHIRQGHYPELREAMTNYNPNRVNPRMVQEANNANQGVTAVRSRWKAGGYFTLGMIYFFPFIANYFSETARRDIAEAADKDIQIALGDKGSTVLAARPFG